MKDLPAPQLDFKDIIEKDLLYVDKTHLFYSLVSQGGGYLYTRPMGFGKSIMLSTLKYLLSGERELFRGLKIAATDYDFKKYPVIYLNMIDDFLKTRENKRNPITFEESLYGQLKDLAANENIELEASDHVGMISELIKVLSEKYDSKVCVLVDEFNEAICGYFAGNTISKKYLELMSNFYSAVSSLATNYIKLMFFTGETRPSLYRLSLGLDNLQDLTFSPEFSSLCGITHDELDYYFSDHFKYYDQKAAEGKYNLNKSNYSKKNSVLEWTDGYSFDGITRVLNTVSVFRCLSNNSDYHKPYSYYDITSIYFLGNRFLREPLFFADFSIARFVTTPSKLAAANHFIHKFDFISFLFHVGFLTLDKNIFGDLYSLKVPNFLMMDQICRDFGGLIKKVTWHEGKEFFWAFYDDVDGYYFHDYSPYMKIRYLKDRYRFNLKEFEEFFHWIIRRITSRYKYHLKLDDSAFNFIFQAYFAGNHNNFDYSYKFLNINGESLIQIEWDETRERGRLVEYYPEDDYEPYFHEYYEPEESEMDEDLEEVFDFGHYGGYCDKFTRYEYEEVTKTYGAILDIKKAAYKSKESDAPKAKRKYDIDIVNKVDTFAVIKVRVQNPKECNIHLKIIKKDGILCLRGTRKGLSRLKK
ncbi:MAG: AAA family ATPase [Deltaproteobacteria bacterium]|jgi:hypothetical protein|nr:AAA family ATPase [Deltaproteobacteria bacterium]